MKKEKVPFYDWLAWKLPKKLIYFCLLRAWAKATTGKYGKEDATKVTMDDAIRRWME